LASNPQADRKRCRINDYLLQDHHKIQPVRRETAGEGKKNTGIKRERGRFKPTGRNRGPSENARRFPETTNSARQKSTRRKKKKATNSKQPERRSAGAIYGQYFSGATYLSNPTLRKERRGRGPQMGIRKGGRGRALYL